MTLFNFTVRATDDAGAFADRDFSIKIRNTVVDRFMAVTAADSFTSPEGSTWTQRVTYGGQSVVHGAGKWLIPISTTQYRLSVDGINYTTHNFGMTHQATPTVRWVNGRFVFVGNRSGSATSTYYLWSSFDGVTWTASAGSCLSVNTATWVRYANVLYINGKWYVTNHQGANNQTVVAYASADDGATWTAISTGYNFPCGGLYHYNGLWIALSFEPTTGGRVYTSNDAVVWTPRTLGTTLASNTRIGTDLLYGNGRLVMPLHHGDPSLTSTVNEVLTSVNGINWTFGTYEAFGTSSGGTAFTGRVTSLYHNGLFMLCCNTVAGTGKGGLRVSEDGINWTTRNVELGALNGLSGLSQG